MDRIKEQDVSFDLNKKIEIALITALYKQATSSLIASWICATVVLIYLSYAKSISLTLIHSWYTFLMIVILSRLFLVNVFLRNKIPQHHLTLWCNLFAIGSFVSGISWGMIGSPLFLPKDPLQQALIMVILAGVCAGSAPAFAPIRRVALFFLVPALLPLIVGFMKQESIYLFFILTLSAFLLHLIILVFRTHQIIKDSIVLQFKNNTLLKELSEAKNQLEITNIRLKQDATHDPLTHVANRSLFEENFAKAIQIAAKEQTILALLYLDLDKFKEVNDQYGHDAGDQLLLIVVARLKNILREQDTVSRLGGDELTVILEDMEDVQSIADIAERVCQTIREPIMLKEAVVQVYASVGISIYPIDGDNANALVRIADRAMYYVKDRGGNNYHFNVQVESM